MSRALILLANVAFFLIGGAAILVGTNLLAQEILAENHRATNGVMMGLILTAYGLSTLHRVLNDLFLFGDEP